MADRDEPNAEGVDLDGMSEYLARTPVVFALLFGSHARGDETGSSDVDVALRFPERMDDHERFHLRNRIDANLQDYAEPFVDVSDVDSLPISVVYAALQDSVILVGDDQAVEAYRKQIETEYEASADERERERREFIDRLARGKT